MDRNAFCSREESDYEQRALARLHEILKRKGYSLKTMKAYLGHGERFLGQLVVPFESVTSEHIHRYIL